MTLASQLIQYLFTGLTLGSIYALVALGFTMIYNATGIINLAQGEFVMLGGLIMVFFTMCSSSLGDRIGPHHTRGYDPGGAFRTPGHPSP